MKKMLLALMVISFSFSEASAQDILDALMRADQRAEESSKARKKTIDNSELTKFVASDVEYKGVLPIKATFSDANGKVVCKIDNFIKHPERSYMSYAYCSGDTIVIARLHSKWKKRFHFMFYDESEMEAFGEATIKTKDCVSKNEKSVIPSTIKH